MLLFAELLDRKGSHDYEHYDGDQDAAEDATVGCRGAVFEKAQDDPDEAEHNDCEGPFTDAKDQSIIDFWVARLLKSCGSFSSRFGGLRCLGKCLGD